MSCFDQIATTCLPSCGAMDGAHIELVCWKHPGKRPQKKLWTITCLLNLVFLIAEYFPMFTLISACDMWKFTQRALPFWPGAPARIESNCGELSCCCPVTPEIRNQPKSLAVLKSQWNRWSSQSEGCLETLRMRCAQLCSASWYWFFCTPSYELSMNDGTATYPDK